jgi:hypothetical protein
LRILLLAVLCVLILATGCGGSLQLNSGGGTTRNHTLPLVLEVEVEPQAPLADGMKSLSAIGELTPPGNLPRPSTLYMAKDRTASFASDLYWTGSQYADDLPNQHVSRSDELAMFNSTYGRENKSIEAMAIAGYRLKIDDYPAGARRQSVKLEWGANPGMGQWFIGFGDVAGDRWVWYEGPAPTDDVLTIDTFAPYVHPDGVLLMIIAVADPYGASLARVTFGAPEMRGTGGGDLPIQIDPVDTLSPPIAPGELPAKFELPSNAFPPIGNQGNTQFCTSYSSAYGALSYQLRRLYGPEWRSFEFPLFWCSPTWTHLGTDDGTEFGVGRYPEEVLDYLKNTGAAVTEHVKDENVQTPDWDLAQCQADAAAIKIADWQKVAVKGDKGIQNIKTILRAEKRPVIFWINIDNTFPGAKGGVYVLPGSPVWTGGAHTMLIVGYDDNQQAFKVRNSWGRDWHDKGYMWFGYQNFRIESFTINAFTLSVEYDEALAQRFFGGSSVAPVRNLQASDGLYNTAITLEWVAAPGAAKYEIFRNGFAAPLATIDDPTVTTWQDKTIPRGDTSGYAYSVVAVNAGGNRSAEVIDRGHLKLDETLDPDIISVDIHGTPLRTGEQATFTAVTDPLSPDVAYELDWNFNGGVEGGFTVDGGTVEVTFTDPGDYLLELTLSSPYGSDTYSLPYTVLPEDNAPVAVLTPLTDAPRNTPIVFDGSSSTAASGRWVAAWQWDLDGDGSYEFNTTTPTMDQIYQDKELRTVRLQVIDNLNVKSAPVEDIFEVTGLWNDQEVDPMQGGGYTASIVRLADGRPAILNRAGDDQVHYLYPDDMLGLGQWNISTIVDAAGPDRGLGHAKLVMANGAPVAMVGWSPSSGWSNIDVLSTTNPLGSSGWTTATLPTDQHWNGRTAGDILGNENPSSDPGTIVLAFHQVDDDDLDAYDSSANVAAAVGAPDGGGGYNFTVTRVGADPDGEPGWWFANSPQLARIGGLPCIAYNTGQPFGIWWVGNYMYSTATSEDGSSWTTPVEITELFDIDSRMITDIDGRLAILSSWDPATQQSGSKIYLNDIPGATLGTLLQTFVPTGTPVVAGMLKKSPSGYPWLLVSHGGPWRFHQSTTAQGTDPADWNLQSTTTAMGYTTGYASAPGATCVELTGGATAIAYGTGGGTGATLRYAVYY